ncbi:hypothetical protein [Streptomyces sp. NPDC090112]|uniref:hypothetical protein n=1 Tax=Streptomyces sp. NPDC090112 TaxID=3365949 RepID=UPI003807B470
MTTPNTRIPGTTSLTKDIETPPPQKGTPVSSSALPWYAKAVLRIAIPLACLGALFMSIPGEIAMARTAGWSQTYAYAMPVCISVYALAAAAIANYRRKAKLPGQMTALIGAVAALILAVCAQSIAHLIQQDYMGSSAELVVAVSAIPPLVIAHLIHMAETPSQVKTASEEKEELRGMIDFLTVELTDTLTSQTAVLLSQSQSAVRQLDTLTEVAESLTEETEGAADRLEKNLTTSPRRGLTKEAIEAAVEKVKAAGEKVTVPNVCQALGVSQATYYRHGGRKALTV